MDKALFHKLIHFFMTTKDYVFDIDRVDDEQYRIHSKNPGWPSLVIDGVHGLFLSGRMRDYNLMISEVWNSLSDILQDINHGDLDKIPLMMETWEGLIHLYRLDSSKNLSDYSMNPNR